MPKLTKRFVESILPHDQKTQIFWDSDLIGFGVVVLPSGRRTYCIQYRNAQHVKKRLKIGIHSHITTEEARDLAKKQLFKVVQGEDPAINRQEKRTLPTIEALSQNYLEHHAQKKRLRSVKEDQKLLRQIILPRLGHQLVTEIERRDIENLHLQLKRTPYHANRVLALLSKMFSLAVAWGWLRDNPIKGIERFQEEKRDRWLNEEELNRFWNALEKHPTHPISFALKLLLLTGARKSEVLHATWDQFDFCKGIWTKPSHLTKQKKKEYLPLSIDAIEVLNSLKKVNKCHTGYLFPGVNTNHPINNLRAFWCKILKEANLHNVRIHDLRHTYASYLVSNGLSLSIVGKLLGHTQASTTHRYAHLAENPLREATTLFAEKLKAVKNHTS